MSPIHRSQQKRRKAARPPAAHEIEALLRERVSAIASARAVGPIEEHFAGYFNELGFRVNVDAATSDAEVLELGNDLQRGMDEAVAGLKLPFTWSIGVYRNDKLGRALSPDTRIHWLCPVCSEEQITTERPCPFCGTAPP